MSLGCDMARRQQQCRRQDHYRTKRAGVCKWRWDNGVLVPSLCLWRSVGCWNRIGSTRIATTKPTGLNGADHISRLKRNRYLI